DVDEHVDVVELTLGVCAAAAVAEEIGILLLAGIRSHKEEVDATPDRADVRRTRILALELDCVAGEAGGDVVRGIGRDSETRYEHDGDEDRHHLQQLRERMRRAQLAVTSDGATAARSGL